MRTYQIDSQLIEKYSEEFLREHRLLPLEETKKKVIFLTDEYPPLPVSDDLRVYCPAPIKFKLEDSQLITNLMNEYLDAPVDTVEGTIADLNSLELDDFSDFKVDSNVEDLEDLAQEAPIIRLVNLIITKGVKKEPVISILNLLMRK